MTREESWEVEGVTLTILRHITAQGFIVSVHRIPSSLLGSPGFVEMHAIEPSKDPPTQLIARVLHGEADDIDYCCACLLAELAGVELEDDG